MKLLITDPASVIVEHDDIENLRAEDESGSFGILAGHADFLTVLTVSVTSWHHTDGKCGYCAVRRGVLTVRNGNEIAIATRQAQQGDNLEALESSVLARFRADEESERTGRAAAVRLHTEAIRRIIEALRPADRIGAGP